MSTLLDVPRLKYPGPRPIVRDGSGNGRGHWDWFYDLSTREQNRLRYHMSPVGCEPDEWASTMDFDDVEAAMRYWQGLVAESRDEWADYEEPEPSELLGLSEIALRLGVSHSTPNKWRARGILPDPDVTVSGTPIWYSETIDAWRVATGR